MKGICFKEHLFQMVISGQKIQTRRVINPQPIYPHYNDVLIDGSFSFASRSYHQYEYIRPRYNIGEKIYLKEPYFQPSIMLPPRQSGYIYRYDAGLNTPFVNLASGKERWKNKLFMPERAARYWIEITNVKVERLQDISERDCIKEGIKDHRDGCSYKRFFDNGLKRGWYADAKESYKHLINAIDGKGTWDNNPFVFVYDFKLTTR